MHDMMYLYIHTSIAVRSVKDPKQSHSLYPRKPAVSEDIEIIIVVKRPTHATHAREEGGEKKPGGQTEHTNTHNRFPAWGLVTHKTKAMAKLLKECNAMHDEGMCESLELLGPAECA